MIINPGTQHFDFVKRDDQGEPDESGVRYPLLTLALAPTPGSSPTDLDNNPAKVTTFTA